MEDDELTSAVRDEIKGDSFSATVEPAVSEKISSSVPAGPTLGAEDYTMVPQPSRSPDDPLNWSWLKKHSVLLALIPGCLLSDWTLTWGTTVFQLQAPEW